MGLDRAPIEFQTFCFFHVWLDPPNAAFLRKMHHQCQLFASSNKSDDERLRRFIIKQLQAKDFQEVSAPPVITMRRKMQNCIWREQNDQRGGLGVVLGTLEGYRVALTVT